ncbi:hypothetical protein GCM10023192_34480 [Amycolatopsis samaneae]
MTSCSAGTGKVWWSGRIPTCPRCLAAIARDEDHWSCVWCGYLQEIVEQLSAEVPLLVAGEEAGSDG